MKLIESLQGVAHTVASKTKSVVTSPEFCLASGITLGIVATVEACRATIKAQDVIEEFKNNIETIHEADEKVRELAKEDPSIREEKYSEEDVKKDIRNSYVKLVFKMVKLYTPSLIIGGFAIAGILTSNKIMRERNVALSAAYGGLKMAYDKYRSRVVERYGKEVDEELYYGVEKEEIEKKIVDEKGKEKTVKEEVKVANIEGCSDYAIYFNDCEFYHGDNDWDIWFIHTREELLRNMYNTKGMPYITLRDALQQLGYNIDSDDPRSKWLAKASMVVGWKKSKNNPDNNDIIFKTIRTYRHRKDGELEPAIIIDFNVDGDIFKDYDKLAM